MAMLISEPTEDKDGTEHLCLQWHPCRDFLAVSSYRSGHGGEVNFFTKKGGKSFFVSKIAQNVRATKIAWHPSETILAVGWDNGRISIIDPLNKLEHDISERDQDEICCMQWEERNSLLLVGDKNGLLVLYSVNLNHLEETKRHSRNQMNDELPVDICLKRLKSKSLLESQDHTAVLKNKELDEAEEQLLDAITKSKRYQALESSVEEAITTTDNTDMVTVFIIGGSKGSILIYLPQNGRVHKIFQAEHGIRQILDMPERIFLLAITDGLMFYQITVEGTKATEKIRVKLTGKREQFSMIQIDSDTIALCYGERDIRIWDLKNEDNALFRLTSEKGYGSTENVICLSYSPKKDCISGGTSEGKIANWRRRRELRDQPIDQQWRLQTATGTGMNIHTVSWSHTTTALAVNGIHSVSIFRDDSVLMHFDTEYAGVQSGSQAISLLRLIDPLETQEIQLPTPPKGIYIFGKNFGVWDEEQVQLYEIKNSSNTPLGIQPVSSFSAATKYVVIHGQSIFTLDKEKINIRTLQGTVKQTISFREMQGDPDLVDVNGKWMCVGTSHGYIQIYDLSGKEIKQHFHSSHLAKSIPDFEKFVNIRINSAGNRVSATAQQKNEEIYEKLFVWDAESDSLGYFSFNSGLTDQQHYEAEAERQKHGDRPKTAAARKIEKERSRFQMPFHLPGNHFWDKNDSRYLICEANHINADNSNNMLLTIFVTSDQGVLMHDLQPKPEKADALTQVSIPYLYFLKNAESEEADDLVVERSISRLVLKRIQKEFVGLGEKDKQAIEAMLNFSFYLSAGQMDNAFKSIRFIKKFGAFPSGETQSTEFQKTDTFLNESVWEHMARMCVKTRRIDVARICLGNMQNARAARSLRKCIEDNVPIDVQAARLAIELDMIDEAKSLYTSMGMYNIINKILQTTNRWSEAFEIAEKYDRINLRNTYYNYAKYLESVGAIEAAIENYEKSGTHKFEVPRMLFEEPKALELYIRRRRDSDLQKWWAQYLESIGEMEGAKNYYKTAGDYLSVVRILCFDGRMDEAVEVISETNDKAAAFHLGRQYESAGDIQEAVTYFTKAHAYSSAIRLAKEHNINDKLANLALLAGGSELIEAARHYEEKLGHADKAVMLYHKAGMIGRALDLAFRTEQFGALDLIAKDLDENSDPRVLERAAQFFSNNQQDRMAVQLLAYAKKYSEAVELCRSKNVIINEELAEVISPPKGDKASSVQRTKLLEEIARCCLQQGNYHFAAKKFTQAGNKLEAMRALLKSGDTPKIILYANTARNKDIYRLVGNYLQSLNWKEDVNLMRQIEAFYMKADALESLSAFYASCAQVEIDDYRDYEKGLAAYSEALRCISKKLDKENGLDGRSVDKMEELKETIDKIKRFIAAKQIYETDPGECMQKLQAMVEEPDMDESVRLGDIHSIIILHNVKRANFKKAWSIIEQCENRRPKVDMRQYLSRQILDQICDEVGVLRITRPMSVEEDFGDEENGVDYSHAMQRRINKVDMDDED